MKRSKRLFASDLRLLKSGYHTCGPSDVFGGMKEYALRRIWLGFAVSVSAFGVIPPDWRRVGSCNTHCCDTGIYAPVSFQ